MREEEFTNKQPWVEPVHAGLLDNQENMHESATTPSELGGVALLEPESLSHHTTIVEWVNSHNPEDLRQEDWKDLSASDEFFIENKHAIVGLTIETHLDAGVFDLIRLIRGVGLEEGDFGNEIAQLLLEQRPAVLLNCLDEFPSFELGKDYIDTMIDRGVDYLVLDYWQLIEKEHLQYAVDLVLKDNASAVFDRISELPEHITITHEYFAEFADRRPSVLLQALADGRFPLVKNDVSILKILASKLSPGALLEAGVIDELSILEIREVWGSASKYHLLSELAQRGIVETQDDVAEFIKIFDIQTALRSIRTFPKAIQSNVFQELVTGKDDEWPKYLKYFSELYSDDYIFILDNLINIFDQTKVLEELKKLFAYADARFKSEFDEAYSKAAQERKNYEQEIERQNRSRFQRYQAELSYWEEGNITVDAYSYHDALSMETVVQALDKNGCVKKAADIQEQAHDTTRTNIMTCVDDSVIELSTDNLGSSNGKANRQEYSEYVVLRDYLRFLQTVDNAEFYGDRESFEENLTYIGEKEYSEAVAGIASYWKWFLDKDADAQLYVDTKISFKGENIKSDVYMLDRILAHFSDDELKKYKGRLLTEGSKVTQKDPMKVKAVLLDDWTISGSQLRRGYRKFVSDYPHLEKSLEVQLIAASKERIALGIERTSLVLKEDALATNIPTKVRAYYLAHKVASGTGNGTRITGSHSSVDYGFASDIANIKADKQVMPMIACVVRPYRQKDYSPVNINRLKKLNDSEDEGLYGRAA